MKLKFCCFARFKVENRRDQKIIKSLIVSYLHLNSLYTNLPEKRRWFFGLQYTSRNWSIR
jgi:hypothetical protein